MNGAGAERCNPLLDWYSKTLGMIDRACCAGSYCDTQISPERNATYPMPVLSSSSDDEAHEGEAWDRDTLIGQWIEQNSNQRGASVLSPMTPRPLTTHGMKEESEEGGGTQSPPQIRRTCRSDGRSALQAAGAGRPTVRPSDVGPRHHRSASRSSMSPKSVLAMPITAPHTPGVNEGGVAMTYEYSPSPGRKLAHSNSPPLSPPPSVRAIPAATNELSHRPLSFRRQASQNSASSRCSALYLERERSYNSLGSAGSMQRRARLLFSRDDIEAVHRHPSTSSMGGGSARDDASHSVASSRSGHGNVLPRGRTTGGRSVCSERNIRSGGSCSSHHRQEHGTGPPLVVKGHPRMTSSLPQVMPRRAHADDQGSPPLRKAASNSLPDMPYLSLTEGYQC